MAARRVAGEPLQYIIGTAPFRSLEVRVGPGVLIPRPETELVAERAMELLPRDGVVVDIGTGSGAIALAVALERPDARVFGTDISSTALDWARLNAAELGADVELFEGDLFEPLPAILRGRVDVAVSNPPYVSVDDAKALPTDVVEHEPAAALFAGSGGMDVIDALVRDANAWLRRGGHVVLEIGETQGADVRALLAARGYADVDVAPDLTGRDRIASARRV